MDAERTFLSCPGRVQDWLGAAADQIDTLLRAPMPSLSGSDEAIGAIRTKRERLSRTTCPYNLRPTGAVSGVSPTNHQISLSVSSEWSPCTEKSSSRCENCVAEERSRCSRDLPSCTRCRKNGMFCFYMEGVPTGRRKPQERRRRRNRIEEGDPELLADALLVAPVLEDPALLETGEGPAAQYSHPETSSFCAVSGSVRQFLEYSAFSTADFPMNTSFVEKSTGPLCQIVTAKRQTTMLPGTPSFSILPHRRSKPESASEVDGPAELRRGSSDVKVLKSSLDAIEAAEKRICQDANWGENRKILENVLQKYVDDQDQHHAAHLAVFPSRLQSPSLEQASAVSSIATTPLASTLGSRSTSKSSEMSSLPITPATELPIPLKTTNTQRISRPHISASRVSLFPFPSYEILTAEDAGVPLSQMEELTDPYLLSYRQRETAYDASLSTNPRERSFSNGFLEELFEEGDAARRLVGL